MAIYSERQPIPTKVVHKVEGGQLGPEMRDRRESRGAIVREVEVDVVLEVQQAIVIRDWLTNKIEQHQKLVEQGARGTAARGRHTKNGKGTER